MTPTNQALALANLCRMGYKSDVAIGVVRQWVSFQDRFSLQTLTGSRAPVMPVFESGMDMSVGGKVFMSCHYGCYPHAVVSIANRAYKRTIYVLIGEEPAGLTDSLVERGRQADVNIEFIRGGFKMLRQVRRALDGNFPLFVAVDVPWGPDRELNVEFPFLDGRIKGKDSLFRMVAHLGVEGRFILATAGAQAISIVNYGELSQAQCYAVLADAVENSPHLYERLFQVHKYFMPNTPSRTAVVWRGHGNQYILHAQKMNAWTVPLNRWPSSGDILEFVGELIGCDVGEVVSL